MKALGEGLGTSLGRTELSVMLDKYGVRLPVSSNTHTKEGLCVFFADCSFIKIETNLDDGVLKRYSRFQRQIHHFFLYSLLSLSRKPRHSLVVVCQETIFATHNSEIYF